MRVIEQARLGFREGSSDKLYEIDLVEVAANQYMVNFRFGRRGSGLRDGTKTALPVALDKAKALFDQLVAEKTAAGYKPIAETPAPAPAPTATPRQDTNEIVLQLQRGFRDGSPVSAVWRAAARDLKEAEPALLELLQAARASRAPNDLSKEGWMHLLVAALARCGTSASLPVLQTFVKDANTPSYVRDAARLAYAHIAPQHATEMTEMLRALVPAEVLTPLEHGDATATARACERVLATQPNRASNLVIGLGLLEDDDVARAALHAIVRVVRLERHEEASAARALYKVAELQRDGALWIAIARRIDAHDGWRPFGLKTRNYFRRRTARTLRRLAQARSLDYVAMATEVLLAYTDADVKPVLQSQKTRRWYGGFAGEHALNDILYSDRSAYERSNYARSAWSTRKHVPPDKVRARMGREERYPALWDQQPAAIWRVLRDGRATPVVEFAVFAMRANRAYADTLPDEEIARVLGGGHRLAQPLAFEIAQVRPMSTALARGALASDVTDAHLWVLHWLQANIGAAARDPEMIALLVTSKTPQIREAAKLLGALAPEVLRSAAARALSIVIGFREADAERASGAIDAIVTVLGEGLRTIGPEILRDMIAHPISGVGELAGELMLRHAHRDTLPVSLVELLLASPHPRVRAYGGKLLATTPAEIAKDDPDALILFATSTNAELREHTRTLFGEVARRYPDVGRAIADRLVDLLMKPLPEGAPAHVVSLLRGELASVLPTRPAATILAMIGALSPHAREAGGLLLPQLGPDDLALEDIVRLAHHEILAIRQGAWTLARAAIARFRLAQAALGRLVDSPWEDTRAFAMRFIDEVGAISADAIIAICDSIRPEVQELGKKLLHERFQTSDAGKYLVRLAEHPSQNIQLLVSSMLEAHVAADLERIRVLSPYLVTVLSQPNRGRIAKARVIALLRKVATHSHEHAAAVAPILDRQSATIAVTQKHPLIATMVEVKEAFPDVALPIVVVPPARNA